MLPTSKLYDYSILFICIINSCNFCDAQTFSKLISNVTSDEFNTWSVSFVDINMDGYDDLLLNSYSINEENLFYKNVNGLFFENIILTELTNYQQVTTTSIADCNNDGYNDILIATFNNDGNALLINNCKGNFFSRTDNALINSADNAHGINWLDFNNDGLLDIFISSYNFSDANQLLINEGNCNFIHYPNNNFDLLKGVSIGSIVADVNKDGFQDIFIPNSNSENYLLLNNQGINFEVISFGDTLNTVGAVFADIDNDRDLDLLLCNASEQNNAIYLNNKGSFTKNENSIISNDGGNSHGASFGDFNNDGWIDLIICNDRDDKNFFYWNNGYGNFTKDTTNLISNSIKNSFGIASSDFDLDGDLDIYISNHSNQQNDFFINKHQENNWIEIDLIGNKSNKNAIGTLIEIYISQENNSFWQQRFISSQSCGAPGSQSSFRQHFGLGTTNNIDSLIVYWSGSQQIQRFSNLEVNQIYLLKEGETYVKRNNFSSKNCSENNLNNCEIEFTPNPTKNFLNFKYNDNNQIIKIEVYNNLGQKYLATEILGDLDQPYINVSHLPPNFYIALIESECGTTFEKFIKY